VLWIVTAAAAAPPWLPGWTARVEVTLDGSVLRAPMTDLPVLIRLSDQAPPGFDPHATTEFSVVFTDEVGATLDFERQAWDPDGESDFWVRVPQLAPVNSESVWMYWGNPYAVDASNSKATWSPWTDAGAWHLEDCTAGCTNALTGGYDLDATFVVADQGYVGDGQTLPYGVPLAHLQWADPGSVSNPFAVSMWFETPAWAHGAEALLAVGPFAVVRCDGSDVVGLSATPFVDACSSTGLAPPAVPHHVALVVDDDTVTFQADVYVDGELATTASLPGALGNPAHVWFGDPDPLLVYPDVADRFSGVIDEVRLRSRFMTADEAHAEYVAANGTLVDFGAVEILVQTLPGDTGVVQPGTTADTSAPGSTGSSGTTAGTGGTGAGDTTTSAMGSGSSSEVASTDSGTPEGTVPTPGQLVGTTVGALSGGRCGCASGSAGGSAGWLALAVVARRRAR
jgi:hypothetical protein